MNKFSVKTETGNYNLHDFRFTSPKTDPQILENTC